MWVDDRDNSQPPWPKPYVRGLDHMVYVGFDSKSSLLADLASRKVIGRVASGMALDVRYWKTTIFPMLMSVVAGSVGLVELHASCVAKDSSGLLLVGRGHSGKSTLAMAMRNVGFRVLSDDRAFCSIKDGKLRAYGISRPIKLRRDAGSWFDEFRGREPVDIQNGEPVFYADLNRSKTQNGMAPCEPRAIVFLERNGEGCRISRMKRSEIGSLIEADLLAETTEAVEDQQCVIDRLVDLPGWHLRYGARPEVIAEQLARLLPKLSDLETTGGDS